MATGNNVTYVGDMVRRALTSYLDAKVETPERRAFDVVFLDPPFGEAPWDALFAAIEPVVGPNAFVYAESDRPIEAPPSLRVLRQARAGGVHYHLLARNALAAHP